MFLADAFLKDWPRAGIDDIWVLARPLQPCFWRRVKDAWAVLRGKAEAVKFYKQ
jgi:hypothetical protein